MTPILKEAETLTAVSSPAAPSNITTKNSSDAAARPQPIPLEVAVTVNGARTVEGSNKREPFSESTKTVLVFANGAVIRLTSSVAPGQLLFVSNEKTKKEVVCQVVKSRNDGTVTGYVELEFTEPAAGFWGMRIPSEAPASSGSAASPKPPVAPRAIAPPAAIPSTTAPPTAPVITPPKIVVAPQPDALSVKPTIPAALPSKPAITVPTPIAVTESKPAAVRSTASLAPPPQIQPVASEPAAPKISTNIETPAKEISSGELKQQAARLQEQLNALLFREAAAEKAAPQTPLFVPPGTTSGGNPPFDVGRQVLELAESDLKPSPVVEVANIAAAAPAPLEVKHSPMVSKSSSISLPVEEVKIPSWLAPLTREPESIPSESISLPEPAPVSKVTFSDADVDIIPTAEPAESTHKSESVVFGGQLLAGASTTATPASGSKVGLFLGVAAAAALLIAGAVWYGRQPGNFLATNSRPPQTIENNTAPVNGSATPPDATVGAGAINSVNTPSSGRSAAQPVPSKPANSPAPASISNTANSEVTTPARSENSIARSNPPAETPKKPALGDVRLSTPNVNRTTDAAGGEAAPSIDNGQPATPSERLAGISNSHASAPSAPLPIGGDVKPAHLLKSVPPLYPSTARSQRVSGDVKLDALIDASGVVTSTTVFSGPAMLHQAAITAVRQWKYEPAQLDGKATAMHLTVTVQFRLQ